MSRLKVSKVARSRLNRSRAIVLLMLERLLRPRTEPLKPTWSGVWSRGPDSNRLAVYLTITIGFTRAPTSLPTISGSLGLMDPPPIVKACTHHAAPCMLEVRTDPGANHSVRFRGYGTRPPHHPISVRHLSGSRAGPCLTILSMV